MVDAAATIEGDGLDASLESALGDHLTDELSGLLVGAEVAGGTELGVERRGGADRLGIDVVDDLSVDVRVGAVHGKTRTLGGATNLGADATLTALEAGSLRLLLVHTNLLSHAVT